MPDPEPIPSWWTSRREQIDAFLQQHVHRGTVRQLARSAGGRPIHAVLYGEPEAHLRGLTNWNSALGARQPDAFWRREARQRPVLMILAGVHGSEVEGMVGALSLLHVMETGTDITGQPQPQLQAKLQRLRLVIIPLTNPDGRARTPDAGWVGQSAARMHRINQGTRRDGSPYGWPGCKAVHPMVGDVGQLGGYFDDAGVNLSHDEFFDPMSSLTPSLLRLARQEAPDLLLDLHSHERPPTVLPLRYVPLAVKQQLATFTGGLYRRLVDAGLPHGEGAISDAGPDGPPGTVAPAFSLTSAFFHAGAALPMIFECPHGLSNAPHPYDFSYADQLRIHHILFERAADWLLERVNERQMEQVKVGER